MLLREVYADRRGQIARQIGEVYRQAAAQQGYDTTELARLAGYSDPVTGARRVEHLMVAGRTRDTGMANALAKLLGVRKEVKELRRRHKRLESDCRGEMEEERAFMAGHLGLIIEQAAQIRTDAELCFTLICQSARVSFGVGGAGYLPLGTLLDFWGQGRFVRKCRRWRCPGTVYLYGAWGSCMSGGGNMGGYCLRCGRERTVGYNYELARDLWAHPLVAPFQERVREGRFLGVRELVERLR
jgi:hypothetical protein